MQSEGRAAELCSCVSVSSHNYNTEVEGIPLKQVVIDIFQLTPQICPCFRMIAV